MISYDQYLQFSPYFAQEDIEKEEERLKFLGSFGNFPQKIKDLLVSMDTTERIINIGKTFRLDEFDTEAFSFAIRKIITGEVFIGDGVELIAHETGLPNERAKNLLSLIVNEIFAPVLEDVKKIQAAKFPQRVGNPVAAAVAPTQTQAQPNLAQRSRPEPSQTSNHNVIDLRNRQN